MTTKSGCVLKKGVTNKRTIIWMNSQKSRLISGHVKYVARLRLAVTRPSEPTYIFLLCEREESLTHVDVTSAFQILCAFFVRLNESEGKRGRARMATLDETLANMSAKHDRLHDMIDIAPQT